MKSMISDSVNNNINQVSKQKVIEDPLDIDQVENYLNQDTGGYQNTDNHLLTDMTDDIRID
jgi:hypothetical protein